MRQLAPAVLAALTLCACSEGKSGEEPDAGWNPTETVTTTLAGIVLDSADGRPLAGVDLSVHGKSATTGADGTFVIEGVSAPRARCALVARKRGYFVAGKAAQPLASGTTRFALRLVKKKPQLIGSTGGTVSLPGGAQVAFQAASFAQHGQALDESVEVSARHLDPTAEDFDRQFPGDLRATREDGTEAMMVSFGVIQVELDDALGEPVELAAERPATLTFPVPPSMQERAPATMPLWYFDEEAAIWKEQGVLALEGDRYVGQVTHFTPWNADMAEETAFVAGFVLCSGKPVNGVRVMAGPNTGFTDAEGRFLIEVPANAPLTVRIDDELARARSIKTAGPIPPNQTEDVGAFDLDACPARLSGRVVNQDREPARATVRVSWSDGVSVETTDAEGRFRTQVAPGGDVTVTVTAEGGAATTTLTRKAPESDGDVDLGDIVVGGTPGCSYWDLEGEPFEVALSFDGARLAMGVYGRQEVQIRDAKTGAVEHTLATARTNRLQFSSDGARLLTGGSFGITPEVWDVATGARLREWPLEIESSWLMPDGATLLALNADTGKVEEYAVADGALVRGFSFDTTRAQELIGLRAEGGQFLALRNASGAFSVAGWDLGTDAQGAAFAIGSVRTLGGALYALSGDGETIAFARPGADEVEAVVDFFATGTGEQINAAPFRGPEPTSFPEHLALSPDGSAFATQQSLGAGKLDLPRMFSLPGMDLVRTLPWDQGRVDKFVFSADGRYLAMVENGLRVRMVDLASCP
ncbi:MAG: hypothetical protein ACOX6T_08440 [Myxococcales bacterium]|jgi:hypothetical protein